MKKVFAVLLALVLCLSLGVAAFAADEEEASATPSCTHENITLSKAYTLNGEETEIVPEETLSFEVSVPEDWTNPDDSVITVADVEAASSLDIVLEFPTYTKMGVYKYTVAENAGDTLGVEYDDSEITVIVTVVNTKAGDGSVDELEAVVNIYDADGEKLDPGDVAFTNEYGVGQMKVTKTVSGNLSSNTKLFTIHVSFSGGEKAGSGIDYELPDGTTGNLKFDENGAASLDIQLKHDDAASFTNIPAGVSYAVEEDEQHLSGDLNGDEGYSVEYENEEGTVEKKAEIEVAVKNEKKTEIQTGVILDSLPYILIAAAVIAALVIMVIRKRRSAED